MFAANFVCWNLVLRISGKIATKIAKFTTSKNFVPHGILWHQSIFYKVWFDVCLTIVTLILIATFRPHTAGLHQAIMSIYWVGLFIPPWLLVIGVSRTIVGGFRSKALMVLSEEETDPSGDRCGGDRLLYLVWPLASTLQESQFHRPCWCC